MDHRSGARSAEQHHGNDPAGLSPVIRADNHWCEERPQEVGFDAAEQVL